MDVDTAPATDILQLPGPCLLAVLQCVADDPRSLFSAARAHSRLHQAAVLALSSIRAVDKEQQQLGSLVHYLGKHGQHVHSIHIEGNMEDARADDPATLGQLPHRQLQGLSSLSLSRLKVTLHAAVAPPSVGQSADERAARLPLQQLALDSCHLEFGAWGLEAALTLLPGLEQLCIRNAYTDCWRLTLPYGELCWPERLSHLELEGCLFTNLQSLQPLTRLQDLRLRLVTPPPIEAAWLSGLQHLTRFEAPGSVLEPGALAGKAQLQHLDLPSCRVHGGRGTAAELLSHLQGLQQLSVLSLHSGLAVQSAPLSAYGALTASSKLQHLDLGLCWLPAGAWQQLLPAGRQLPHLTALRVGMRANRPGEGHGPAAAPEASRLVSCCPGLQSLHMDGLWFDAQQVAPLVGLSSLQDLRVARTLNTDASALAAVCQMTQLRQLSLCHDSAAGEGLLLQLTQLQELVQLTYCGPWQGSEVRLSLDSQAPGSEPVWRQLLRHQPRQPQPAELNPCDPAAGWQQVAATQRASE